MAVIFQEKCRSQVRKQFANPLHNARSATFSDGFFVIRLQGRKMSQRKAITIDRFLTSRCFYAHSQALGHLNGG
jgi:predicted nucleic-acid-binding protein